MKRWTKEQKEWLGHKRKMAYDKDKVTLSVPPWEKQKSSIELNTREEYNNVINVERDCKQLQISSSSIKTAK